MDGGHDLAIGEKEAVWHHTPEWTLKLDYQVHIPAPHHGLCDLTLSKLLIFSLPLSVPRGG